MRRFLFVLPLLASCDVQQLDQSAQLYLLVEGTICCCVSAPLVLLLGLVVGVGIIGGRERYPRR